MKTLNLLITGAVILLLAVNGSAQRHSASQSKDLGPSKASLDVITSEGVLKHIKVLASDQFEGRGPGTRGENLSINYISDQFKTIGLSPVNTDGTYFLK